MLLSAHSRKALEAQCRRLRAHLHGRPALALADIAFTLQSGRRHFTTHRVAVVCQTVPELLTRLERLPVPAGASSKPSGERVRADKPQVRAS